MFIVITPNAAISEPSTKYAAANAASEKPITTSTPLAALSAFTILKSLKRAARSSAATIIATSTALIT